MNTQDKNSTQNQVQDQKPKRQFLLTDSQRAGLRGEKSHNYRKYVRCQLRKRVESDPHLADLQGIKEHEPRIWEDLRDDLETVLDEDDD